MKLSLIRSDEIYDHLNCTWRVDKKDRTVVVTNTSHKSEEENIRIPIGVAPYSFFFQGDYAIITSKEFDLITIIKGKDCWKPFDITYSFDKNGPYYAVLSPNNKFILFADKDDSLKSIFINDGVDFNSEVDIISENIKNINEISFTEDYLIINQNIHLIINDLKKYLT